MAVCPQVLTVSAGVDTCLRCEGTGTPPPVVSLHNGAASRIQRTTVAYLYSRSPARVCICARERVLDVRPYVYLCVRICICGLVGACNCILVFSKCLYYIY